MEAAMEETTPPALLMPNTVPTYLAHGGTVELTMPLFLFMLYANHYLLYSRHELYTHMIMYC